MKKRKLSAIKLFFLFATLGAFPFIYPATQYRYQPMPMDKQAVLPADASMSKALRPIDPALGDEVKPDTID